ncbi:crosslink repair DNA glycosylase YcaQ family protein [Rhodococcus sp. HNM0569]|uniref:winged helix-turn-helix domain-containing protein n=1 Tax=Rhodococcus sp. HNM0569 TaxID=2716340 RepID=UPI00146BA986|nr:crosslink repair DNA glycosylase YcaQ family protein [Rhodococcus sp. HNM0569]NLU81462.1 winged helix-turn-helix domain-containing protein [Rhodococcus sp. HNM0569]
MEELTAAAARRIGLAAQGFGSRPVKPTRRAVASVTQRLGLYQIDSVSVVVRAHYMPLFSRLGAYDRAMLDDAAWSHSARRPRTLVEYWAHEAAFMPIELWPHMRWRMQHFSGGRWGHAAKVEKRNPSLAQDILDVVAERGAVSAGEIETYLDLARPGKKGPWWDRSDTKIICEQLFSSGALAVDSRGGFVRHYDLAERVVPPRLLNRRVDEADAIRELVARSVRALGVGTEADIRDYYRLSAAQTKPALRDLVDAGSVARVGVQGTDAPAFLDVDARKPRRIDARALLCPFDPLIFFRPRTERMFGFRYRIEIYTPAARRVHGYYVFPFLLGDELVARVDLKADRARGVLDVRAAWHEPGVDTTRVAGELATALGELAEWLELGRVEVADRGDLAGPLRTETTASVSAARGIS